MNDEDERLQLIESLFFNVDHQDKIITSQIRPDKEKTISKYQEFIEKVLLVLPTLTEIKQKQKQTVLKNLSKIEQILDTYMQNENYTLGRQIRDLKKRTIDILRKYHKPITIKAEAYDETLFRYHDFIDHVKMNVLPFIPESFSSKKTLVKNLNVLQLLLEQSVLEKKQMKELPKNPANIKFTINRIIKRFQQQSSSSSS